MEPTPRLLRKPDVEALLAAVSGPAASVLEEITVVRHALGAALVRVLGVAPDSSWATLVAPDSSWATLVTTAAERGAWPSRRATLVAAAEAPDRSNDPEAVLDALWDLVRELNEVRTIRP